ncbi:hypothetical protein BaRGS_00038872 [Batillaria attramentaria]|uniref:Uncharacterized protein n=1 Tax=Batillaria attramentaria TaxID=370345 RepID=A0ABD0J4T9_9CAEN
MDRSTDERLLSSGTCHASYGHPPMVSARSRVETSTFTVQNEKVSQRTKESKKVLTYSIYTSITNALPQFSFAVDTRQ